MELSALARVIDENRTLDARDTSRDTTMSKARETAMSEFSVIASHPAPNTSPQLATETRFRV